MYSPRTIDKVIITAGSLFFPGIRTRMEAEPGGSILDLIRLAKIPERYHSYLTVWLDEMPIPETFWPRVRPRAGHILAIGMAPAGDLTGANGKDTLQLAIPVMLQFGAMAGALALGAPGILAGAASLAGGGIGVWIAQNLIHVPEPYTNPGFSTIVGARNQVRKYECVPRVYGRIRYAPPLAAMADMPFEGADQYAKLLLTPGHAPLAISAIRIGDIPIVDAEAVNIQIERVCHWHDQDTITLFSRDVHTIMLEKQLNYADSWINTEDRSGAESPHLNVVTAATQEKTTEVTIDFLFPDGLWKENNKEVESRTVTLAIRYRLRGATGSNSWMLYSTRELVSPKPKSAWVADPWTYTSLATCNSVLTTADAAMTLIDVGSRTVSMTVWTYFLAKLSSVDARLAANIAQGFLTSNQETESITARVLIASISATLNTATITADMTESTASDFNDALSGLTFVLDAIDCIEQMLEARNNNLDWDSLPACHRLCMYELGLTLVWPPRPSNTSAIIVTAASAAPLPYAVSWYVPEGQYDIQVRKTSADNYGDQTVHAVIELFAYRSTSLEAAVSEAMKQKLAFVAMKIKATDEWNNQIDQITMLCESPLYWHDGLVWRGPDLLDDAGYEVSRNPAWQMCDILRGGAAKEPITDDDDLDLVRIREFANYCNTHKYTCDIVFDKRVSAEEAMMTVCRCGKATPSKTGEGKYTVIIDQPQTTPVALITPRVSSNFVATKNMEERPHALRVKFQNANKDYQEDEAYVYADGYGIEHGLAEPTVIEDVEMPGVTSPTMIKHLGRYFLACSQLRPEIFQVDIDFKAIVFERGDQVLLQHDVPLFGRGSARITALEVIGARTFVTLDEHPTAWAWGAGASNAIRIQTGGNLFAYTPCIYDIEVDADRLYVDEPYPTNWGSIAVGDLIAVGAIDLETVECIVRGISPGPDLTYRVTFLDHAPEVHDADDDIPEYDSHITLPYHPELARPPRPEVIGISTADSATVRQTDGTKAARILLSLRLSRGVTPIERVAAQNVTGVEVQYQRISSSGSTNDPWQVMPVFTRDLSNVYVDPIEKGKPYNIRVRSVTRTGVPSEWFLLLNIIALGKQARPPDVTSLKYENGVLTWNTFISPDFAGFEVRMVIGNGNTWGTAATAHSGLLYAARFECPKIDRVQVEYFVKAFDTSGNESHRAAYLAITIPASKEMYDLGGYADCLLFSTLNGMEAYFTGDGGVRAVSGRSTRFYDGSGEPLYRAAGTPFYGTLYGACSLITPILDAYTDATEESNANVTHDNTEFIWFRLTQTSDKWRLLYRNTAKDLWPADLDNNLWPDDMNADFWPDHSANFEVLMEKPRTPLHPDASTYGHQFKFEFPPCDTRPDMTSLRIVREFRRLEESGQGLAVADSGNVYIPIKLPWQYCDEHTVALSNDPDQNVNAVGALALTATPNSDTEGPKVVVYGAGGYPADRVEGIIDFHLVGF